MEGKENSDDDPVSTWVRRTRENKQLYPEAISELIENGAVGKNDKRFLNIVQKAVANLPDNDKRTKLLQMVRSRNFFR